MTEDILRLHKQYKNLEIKECSVGCCEFEWSETANKKKISNKFIYSLGYRTVER